MRPTLNPALRRVWRDSGTVQFGIDPEHAVVVSGLDDVCAQLVVELDGRCDDVGLRARATELGGDFARVQAMVRLLRASGVLSDRPAGTGESGDNSETTGTALSTSPPDELRAELAGLSLLHGPGGAARILAARRTRVVQILGAGQVGSSVTALLVAAGLGTVAPWVSGSSRASSPDLVILAPEASLPDPVVVEQLMRRDIAHLVVGVRETTAVVGPLVVPGTSACLRCLHLHRVDRDPAWPRVAAQLCAPVPEPPTGVVLATVAAAGAALQALSWLDGVAGLPVIDGCVETTLPLGTTRRRSWSTHPRCGCTWAHHAQVAPLTHLSDAGAGGRPDLSPAAAARW